MVVGINEAAESTNTGSSHEEDEGRQLSYFGGLDEEMIATSAKTPHPDVHMEDQDNIWAMLPGDLFHEILARVLPVMIYRLRYVCKRWNLILQDHSFLKYYSQVPSHGPCLLTFLKISQTPQCSIFSLPLKQWYKIPLTFLPPWACWLVGSSGGLVCFSGLDGVTFTTLTFRILICNPLTQSWRTLPSMHHHNIKRRLIMVVDRKKQSFKVIAASCIYGDKSLPTEVYDSKDDSWSLHKPMLSKMAICDSRLYLETNSYFVLMMYQLDAVGDWEYIPARFPRSLLDYYLVAGSKKRLFLVGRIAPIGLDSTFESMRIWELDHSKLIWVEISRMPPKYFRDLLRLSEEKYKCFGQDNLICFTSWNQGKSLLFNADRKTWYWVAGCDLQSYDSQVCFYEPRLDDSIWSTMIQSGQREGSSSG